MSTDVLEKTGSKEGKVDIYPPTDFEKSVLGAHEVNLRTYGIQYEDANLPEKLMPAIKSALACKASCTVNPINTLHKIRDAFGKLVGDGEITADESVSCVARMMSAAGENFQSRKDVVDQFKAGNLSVLKLNA